MADRPAQAITPARGFMAEHAHYDEDAGFWEAHADRLGGPVCDLGAAAGRVTVQLAQRGHEVWAVDTDPEMLMVIAERAAAAGVGDQVHPVLGSMTETLPIVDAGLIVAAMNTLQLLRSEDEQVACLSRAATALRPGGEMIFDLALPAFPAIGDILGEVLDTGSSLDPGTGDRLVHTARFETVNADTGDVRMRIMIARVHPGGTRTAVERLHHLHMYAPDEIPRLAERAGLMVLEAAGGFHGEPLSDNSERHVWRLGRSG